MKEMKNIAGSWKLEEGSRKSEDRSRKTEAGSQGQSVPVVYNRVLYFVCPAVVAHTGKENIEYRK